MQLKKLTSGSSVTYKEIWLVAYPIIIGGLAENINNVINTAFVGSLGDAAIGAVGMGGMYYFNFVILALGLAAGSQIIIARRNGEGKFKEAGRYLRHSLILFIGLSLTLMALLHIFSPYILRAIISSTEVYNICIEYVGLRIFGLLFICIAVSFRSFYIGITKTRIITLITFISAGLNVLLDYLLIFGNFGFPQLGIKGAAIASIIAESAGMLGYIIATVFLPFLKKFDIFKLPHFQPKLIWKILRVGSPLMLQNWISFSAWMVLFVFIEKMGERDLAASSIIKSIYLLFLIPMWGFAAATNTMTSNLIGQGRINEVTALLKKILILSISIMIIMVQFNFLFPRKIISFFNTDPGLIEATVGPLWVVSVALILYSASVILFNGVSGAGDTRVALIIELITIAFYLLYVFIITRVFQMNMMIVWTSELVYMGLLGVLSYFRLHSGKWKKAHI